MPGEESGGSHRGEVNGWRLTALLLLVVALGVVGVLVAVGPPDQEAEAAAVLRTRVRADAAAGALRSPSVLGAIARSTGTPGAELRDDLSITEAEGFRLAVRYRPGAPVRARGVAIESVRQVGSELLDDALTRADRALVAAERSGAGVAAAERVAQAARDTRDATFDIRVETATVRPGWWTAGIASAAALLLLAVTAFVVAARRRPTRTEPVQPADAGPGTGAPDPPTLAPRSPATPALSLEELEQRLAELTRHAPEEATPEEVPA